MTAILGIGNHPEEYQSTRHNIGFMVVDVLAEKLGIKWTVKNDLKCELAKDKEHILIKPLTYVNLSGEAASLVTNFFKIPVIDLWVVHDEADLPLGTINIKSGGTSAGHNGIKSIDEHLGADYWRVRIGIGKSGDERPLSDHVLSKFTVSEQEIVDRVIDQTVDLLVKSLKDNQLEAVTIHA